MTRKDVGAYPWVMILITSSAQDSFTLAPIFNASMPQLDFSVQVSLRTVFSVTVEDINIGALYLDLPAFNLTVNTLTNAMSNCQTPPAGTPSDEIYAELIHLNGALVAELSYEILDGGKTGIIDTWTIWDALDKCYAFFPGLGSIGAVPASSKSPLLTAPAITTCTTGTTSTTGTAAIGAALKSLSPGAKAGVVIGEYPSSRRRIPFSGLSQEADVLIDLPLLLPKYTDFEFLPCRDLSRRRAYRSSSLVQWSCKSKS